MSIEGLYDNPPPLVVRDAAFGGSFLNHQYLICACAPTYPNAPAPLVSKLDAAGRIPTDAQPGKSSDVAGRR